MRRFGGFRSVCLLVAGISAAGLQVACAPPTDHDRDGTPTALVETAASTEGSISKSLAGTAWKLAEIQASGESPESEPLVHEGEYRMTLGKDGQAEIQLDCSQANGPWSADPVAAETGVFSIGPLAMSQEECASRPLDQKIVQDMDRIQRYLKRDGKLDLRLKAGDGSYVWEPADQE